MSPAQTTASGRSSAGGRLTVSQPAALKRLNRSLDTAQDALVALRRDVTKDVSAGTRSLQADLERFIRDARRDTGKLGRALQRDLRRVQKRIAPASGGTRTGTGGRRRPARSTASRRTPSRA
jgi:hypothetical protein